MKPIHFVVAATAFLLAGSAIAAKVNLAPAPHARVPAIMHERHEGMEKVGKLTKQLSRAIKAEPMDARTVRMNAEAMDIMAQQSTHWFPAGTGPEAGKTGAKAEIWQKPQDFSAKVTAWQTAARNFRTAARSADPQSSRAAFAELGKSCKSCHETYRKDMH